MSIKVDALQKEIASLKEQRDKAEESFIAACGKVHNLNKLVWEAKEFKDNIVKWPFGFYRIKNHV